MDKTTRPWYTIDELNEWADKYQNQEWRNAAIRLGEELASVGPDGYYNMEAKDWLNWAMENVKPSQSKQEQDEPKEWIGLTHEEISVEWFAVFDAEPGIGKNITNGVFDFANAIEAKLKEKNAL